MATYKEKRKFAFLEFQRYVSTFDQHDPKIMLKYRHTLGVIQMSEYLASSLGLSEEDCYIAYIIALLHDIGRFFQLREFHSFYDGNLDHGEYAIQLLFDEGYIRKFVLDYQYDRCIRFAIGEHSKYQISAHEDKRCILHALLIRDSDKLDNFRVKDQEDIMVMLDVSREEIEKEKISEEVYDVLLQHRSIPSSLRKSHLDYYVSFIGFIYDLNFAASFQYIKKHRYDERLFSKLEPQDTSTKNMWDTLKQDCFTYIEKHMQTP